MTYESAVLTDGPSLMWMLNETSGTSAADATGSGHTGTYTNTYTLGAPGPPGVDPDALQLPGASGLGHCFTVSGPSSSTPSGEAWFKTTPALATGGGIFAFQSTNFIAWLDNSGQVWSGFWDGSNTHTVVSPLAYNDGGWHYIAATQDGTTQTLYIDGASVVSAAMAHPVASGATTYAGNGGNITTAWPGTTASNYITGEVSALAQYTYALTSGQVAAHYAAAVGSAPPRGLAMAGIV